MDAAVMDKMLIVLAIISTVESSYIWGKSFGRNTVCFIKAAFVSRNVGSKELKKSLKYNYRSRNM